MCNNCGVNNCGCKKPRFNGQPDRVLIPGPQGDPGTDGADGAQGPQGLPGINGGLQFEHYFTAFVDAIWQVTDTVQPEFNHNVSVDGNYQIHIDLISQGGGDGANAQGVMKLFIDGVQVDTSPVIYPNIGIVPSGQALISNNVMYWRGPMLAGQLIEVKHVAAIGNIVSLKGNMLVNLES